MKPKAVRALIQKVLAELPTDSTLDQIRQTLESAGLSADEIKRAFIKDTRRKKRR